MTDRNHVLFIDDDPAMQALATAMLPGKLFEVFAVSNTVDGEKILRGRRVDIVVCDVMMADEDGFQFYDRLKQTPFSKPFLFLSAVGDPRTVQRGIASGANEYLVKPFDIQELARKLIALTARSRKQSAA